MIIVCRKTDSVIICIANDTYTDDNGEIKINLSKWSNGYPVIVDKCHAFIPEDVNILMNIDVPDEVEENKFCYTPEEGFYINPEWIEPNKYGLPNEVIQKIQDDTIADLIELGVL